MKKSINHSSAFTLAEVLITLGIIGVVAAMTMPVLIQNNNVKTTETRLKKVYSVMNQAIRLSENVNGPKESWDFSDEKFIEKYFAPYLNKVDIKEIKGSTYSYLGIYFSDGSLLLVKNSSHTSSEGTTTANTGMHEDYYFYPSAKNFDLTTFDNRSCCGKSCFAFRFSPNLEEAGHYKKGFEPYKHLPQQLSESILLNHSTYGCKEGIATPLYCTALIQLNGWTIPENYPFKVK